MSAFNDTAFLSEAMESVLRQTFRNFECLVIDDSSTDGSARLPASTLGVQDPSHGRWPVADHIWTLRELLKFKYWLYQP